MHLNKKLVFETLTKSPNDLAPVADFLKTQIHEKVCFLLDGDLAAGKTTLVVEFCKQFGIYDVASPTFAIHHVYSGANLQINHFDLYRLESVDEVETSGVWEVLSKPRSITFIEWPQRLNVDDIPMDVKKYEVLIQKKSESEREVKIYQLS